MEVKGEKLEIGYDGRIVVREMVRSRLSSALTVQVNLLC